MREKLEKEIRREEFWRKLIALFCLSAKKPSQSGFSKEECEDEDSISINSL